MAQPLMPKATAIWLVDNTTLTFEQIAFYCGLHVLEIQGIADAEVGVGMLGLDPLTNHQLTAEEIKRCEDDPTAQLQHMVSNIPEPRNRTKGPRYTPVSKRQDKPDAILWLIRNFPELKDSQINHLIGTTKPTITAIRDRTHWNMSNIRAQHPVVLGLCTQFDLDQILEKAGIQPHPPKTLIHDRKTEIGESTKQKETNNALLSELQPALSEDKPPLQTFDAESLFKSSGNK